MQFSIAQQEVVRVVQSEVILLCSKSQQKSTSIIVHNANIEWGGVGWNIVMNQDESGASDCDLQSAATVSASTVRAVASARARERVFLSRALSPFS